MINKKIYFLSDLHLGSVSHTKKEKLDQTGSLSLPQKQILPNNKPYNHEIEKKICRWLDMVKSDAGKIFLLGDIFDFWFEYKEVVPRGFTRVFGKIAELTDMGIEVHFFIGNHDIWTTDYFQQECGMIVHREALVVDIYGKKFFLAHGDGLGERSNAVKFMRAVFHNRLCQKLFSNLHPRWAIAFGKAWSNHSRMTGGVADYLGEENEYLVQFAKQQLQIAPNINYFVFGHRHILLNLAITKQSQVIILGDWISFCSYGVFDGETFSLEIFES